MVKPKERFRIEELGNGRVHWYTLKEMPLMGVKPYNLSDK